MTEPLRQRVAQALAEISRRYNSPSMWYEEADAVINIILDDADRTLDDVDIPLHAKAAAQKAIRAKKTLTAFI